MVLFLFVTWEQRKLREVFDYERPDTYIVKSDKYSDTYSTPVLTANKGFILGYTNEMQVCNKECIIFDDFTLDSKYVTFPFMVKSSALKILTAKIGYFLPFAYQLLQATNIEILGHARHYISVVQPTKVLIPSNDEQIRIGKCIQQIDNLITLHQRKQKCKFLSFPTSKAGLFLANSWEQRKLGEMGETYAGLSSKSKEDFGHGEAEFVPYMNVFTNPIADVAMTEAIEIDDRQAKVKNGDVLFTTSSETPEEVGMSSVWLKNGSNTYLNSFCFGFRASESINSYYLAYMLRSSGVRRKIVFLAQGISRYNISKKKMMEIKVPMPISAEQRQLGEIFRQLDNLITLHQCKDFALDTNKAFQQRCLLSIKSANAWEQRKAKTLFISYAEKGYPELPVLSATQDKGMVYRDDTGKNIFHDKNNEISYKRVQPGQFVIHLRSFQGGFAHSNILGITSPAYTIFGFKDDEKQCDLYWKYVFCSSEFVKRLETVTYGIRDGRSISYDEFLTMKFIVPKYEEQVQIASILIEIDNLITLHQRKQTIKKRSKMDEKRRVNYLMIANAWEQRKLGDVGKAQSGIGFPDREQGGKEGVPFYKVSDMNNYGNEHEMHSANNYVTEEQCRRNGWTPITEISVVFAKVGAAIMLNRKRLVRFSFLLDNNTMAYRFGSGWDINFGKTLFERVDLTELVQIGALPSYNATDVESVEISMPDKPEQYQIGEFFKQLDNLITLHQRGLIKIQGDKKWQKRKFQKNCSAIILNAG